MCITGLCLICCRSTHLQPMQVAAAREWKAVRWVQVQVLVLNRIGSIGSMYLRPRSQSWHISTIINIYTLSTIIANKDRTSRQAGVLDSHSIVGHHWRMGTGIGNLHSLYRNKYSIPIPILLIHPLILHRVPPMTNNTTRSYT